MKYSLRYKKKSLLLENSSGYKEKKLDREI